MTETKWPLFCGNLHLTGAWRGVWCRVLGYGFAVSDVPPLFSERNGLSRYWMLGRWKLKLFSPER
jgi:hypothetical protein